MKIPRIIRVVLTDLAGTLLIIGAVLFGWLPGPGGIPMFLAGLGLFAVHHSWAKKLLRYVKEHSSRLQEILFPNHALAHVLYDIAVGVLLVAAIVVFYKFTGSLSTSIGILLAGTAIGIFFSNRQRLQKISKKIGK